MSNEKTKQNSGSLRKEAEVGKFLDSVCGGYAYLKMTETISPRLPVPAQEEMQSFKQHGH